MDIIRGKREGSYIYIYEDYTYNIDARYDYIYRCTKRHSLLCKGVLYKEDEKYILRNKHNHPEEPSVVETMKLKEEMIEMCRQTNIHIKEIFDTVCRKNPTVAANISFPSMRCTLSRERMKLRPTLPSTLSDLGSVLLSYEPANVIYKGCVTSDDNKHAFIFTSDKLLEVLNNSSELFIDGTFSVVPKTPNFVQLYSVHTRYSDKGIPTLFILCESRTSSLYKAVWKEIVKLAPKLESNLQFVMSDYEKAAISAVHEQFPQVSIHGCWFHYCQSILKKWKKLDLMKAPYKLVSMAMTLPLAPPELFKEGLDLLQSIAIEEYQDYPTILQFMWYMKKTWLPIATKVSVYGCALRTNNIVESFHNILAQKLQTVHPNFWIFLDNILKVISDIEIDYERLQRGVKVKRNRSQFNKMRNLKIKEAQNDLSTGIYSLKEFLQLFHKEHKQQHYVMETLTDDIEEEEIYAELHAEGIVPTASQTHLQNERSHSGRRRRRNVRVVENVNIAEASTNGNDDETGEYEFVENTNNNNNEMDENEMLQNGNDNGDQAEARQVSLEAEINTESNNEDNISALSQEDIQNNNDNQAEITYASRETTNNESDFESDIYAVPEDDYNYWLDDEDNAQEEIPFLSITEISLHNDSTALTHRSISPETNY